MRAHLGITSGNAVALDGNRLIVANYHLAAKMVGRASGKSAVAAAAYRAGEKLADFRQGVSWVVRSEIIAPAGAPAWALDRQALWNGAEAREDKSTRRDTAQVAREFEISLPYELSREDREAAALELARYLVDTYGVVADVSFHDPHKEQDERNFHAHILTTTRVMTEDGLGAKVRELDSKATGPQHLAAIREKWADIANRHLEAAGLEARIDHRSYKDQGSDREATIHLGVAAAGMENRGEESERGDTNREIEARNAERERLKAEAEAIGAEIIDLAEERARRQAEKEITASARTHDPARVLDAITERRSTVPRGDLNFALTKEITDAKERSAFMDEVLSHGETVALRDEADGPVTRYTTQGVLRAEGEITDAGRNLVADQSHGIRTDRLADCLDRHAGLDQEQRQAVAYCTGAEGLAVLAGEAGTGKSRTMAAIREAYEAEGCHVVGMAWTNAVVQDMAASGFEKTTTIAAEIMRQNAGRGAWDSDTVLMVDEAAMLSTRHLAEVMTRAQDAGAKLILVGDEKQLASIEAGGMFGALREEHGAAELHTVRRVQDEDQKAAFNQMHRGDFRAALDVFEARGAIHWQAGEDATRAALVEKYAADSAADPGKTRFVFAYTNAEVAELNAAIRTTRQARGELGEDHVLQTKDGPAAFAEGDRVQFTGGAWSRDDKAAGLVNGMVGIVQQIEDERMTVRLDVQDRHGRDRVVSFTVGENAEAGEFNAIRHGYAGTIYKGQGRTLDETYVLHSKHWRAASSYVALTRHREDVAVFVDKEAAPTLDRLAHQIARVEEKRAASQFHRDPPTPEQALPPVVRRYAALDETHERIEAAGQVPPPAPANQNAEGVTDTPAASASGPQEATTAPAAATARPDTVGAREAAARDARAQWVAARVEKVLDARKQALRLQRHHRDDQQAEPKPLPPERHTPPGPASDLTQPARPMSAAEQLRAELDANARQGREEAGTRRADPMERYRQLDRGRSR
jgi:Ti-type conjugative transfer relaxase TraA